MATALGILALVQAAGRLRAPDPPGPNERGRGFLAVTLEGRPPG